jgi:phospholipase C
LNVTLESATQAADAPARFRPLTPIRHLVVIFQENVSFDHYFGTYPVAANPAGEPQFVADSDTPTVNGLNEFLLTTNPNGVNPSRVDRSHVNQCDQNHEYLLPSADRAALVAYLCTR